MVSFLLMTIVTMGVTFWLGIKKDWHAIFAIAPYSLFIVGIIMLNTDPTFDVPMNTLDCTYVEGNGTWNAVCADYDHTVTYDIDVTVLQIVNVLVFVCAFFILLIGYERIKF